MKDSDRGRLQQQEGIMSDKAWVAVGDQENWERGLESGIWGIVPELEHHWQRIARNDIVLFYCVAPVSRFFGSGIIRSKFRQTNPLWKEEIEQKKVIWPFRFEFDVVHLVPFTFWRKQGVRNAPYNLAILAGLNPVANLQNAMKVLEALPGHVSIPAMPRIDIAGIVHEIGRIQRMLVERDYPVDGSQLDVIWKRTIRSVPTYAFEINLEGGFEKPLQTLKHAYDIWNSRPFLITDQQRVSEVNQIVSGLYHEFAPSLMVLSTAQVQDLYDSKKTYYDLEEKYGLR
jgi:hypothetical protein